MVVRNLLSYRSEMQEQTDRRSDTAALFEKFSAPVSFRHARRAPGLPDFSWSKHTKTGKLHIPNDPEIYQMATKNTKWP
jgi:hypothetical protein